MGYHRETPLLQRQAWIRAPQSSAVSSGRTTPRRWSSGSPSRPGRTSSSTTSSPSIASCPPGRCSRSTGSSPRCGPATRGPGSRATCSSSPTGGCRPRSPRRRWSRSPGSCRRCSSRHCPAPRSAAPSATSGRPRSTTTRSTRRLPAGLSRDGEPVYLDVDFIDGTKGAHVNISGISGVATKTSYATFLLYSLFGSGVLGAEAANTKALVFNVKGEDLLFLDHPNVRLDEDEPARYAALGLPARPFRSVGVLAPPRRGDPNATPDVGSRATGVRPFLWTIHQFCAQGLLPFLFADAEDERQQYTIVVQSVTARLRELAEGQRRRATGRCASRASPCARFRDLVDVIHDKLVPADPDEPVDQRWTGRAVGGGIDQRVHPSPRVGHGARRAPHPCRHRRRPAPRARPRVAPGHRRRHPRAARAGPALRRRRRAAPGVRAQGGVRAWPSRCSSSCSTS